MISQVYNMEKDEPKGIAVEEFEQRQVVKAGDLGMISGTPKFNAVYDVKRAVKMCLFGFKDRHKPTYGRLHLMINPTTLPGGMATVVSTDQRQPIA